MYASMLSAIKRQTIINFCSAFLFLCLSYRIRFLIEIKTSQAISYTAGFSSLALGLIDDLVVGLVLGILLCLMQVLLSPLVRWQPRMTRVLGSVVLCAILFLFSADFIANRKIYFVLFTGNTLDLIFSANQQGFTPDRYHDFMSVGDVVLLVCPILLFVWLQAWQNGRVKSFVIKSILLSVLFGIACGIANVVRYSFYLEDPVVYLNPLHYAYTDYWMQTKNAYVARLDQPSAAQMHSVSLVDKAFAETSTPIVIPSTNEKSWNVVFIILESVAWTYVHDQTYAADGAMPFLHSLAKQGMWLNNNYTGGNTSLYGAFSLLTGIYPSPMPSNFEMKPDIHIPSLAAWLGKQYDSFFVMADDKTFFFQPALIEKSGFKRLYDYNDIPTVPKPLVRENNRDEIEATNFFLSEVKKEKQPFLAVYWSAATHAPYIDYGVPHRVTQDLEKPYARYYNNLRLVDQQIKRIYDFLQANHLADKTILVVVGDHGEGFGQHPDSWFHGHVLYQEQIKVPVLFYQPALFKPQVVDALTTTADIVPTLLHALGIAYNPALLQGSPIINGQVKHKYVFVYGRENELVSINPSFIKTQISFAKGRCRRYDLKEDPKEQHPFNCIQDAQEQAMIAYRNYQPEMLERFNSALLQACTGALATDCLLRAPIRF